MRSFPRGEWLPAMPTGAAAPRRGSSARISRARLAARRAARLFARLLLIASPACASPPPIAQFTLVTRQPGVVRPEVLRRDIEGEWCFTENVVRVTLRPPWRARFADPGRAVAAALEQVPGANVLTDVSVSVRVEQYLLFQRICAIVTGDAGRIE